MFKTKSYTPFFVLIAIVISLVCFVTTSVLLRPVSNNIIFIEQELKGLVEYQHALKIYFDLFEKSTPQATLQTIQSMTDVNGLTVWKTAKEKLKKLRTDEITSESVAEIIRQTIKSIGDESNLILDPALQSYYLVDILLNQIPLLVLWNTEADAPTVTPNINHYFERLDHAAGIVGSNDLLASANTIKQDWKDVRNTLKMTSPIGVRLQHIQSLSVIAINMLEEKLHQRLAKHQRQWLHTIWIILGFYTALIVTIFVAVKNYVNKREVGLSEERKTLIALLAQKNNELEQFAHVAAHDLKEPIRTMRCYATLLNNESGDDLTKSAGDYIKVIEDTAKRAEQMINDLLSYSQESKEPTVLEACDCNIELHAVLSDLKPMIEAIKPIIEISDLPVFKTAPSMFRRVMLNLIDNAIKYRSIDRPLIITISAERKNNQWLFSVHDNGIGIDPAYIDSVFEPFKRLHETPVQGNGIGLSSCKKIVEHLGGNILIKPNPNQGIAVYFSLPA